MAENTTLSLRNLSCEERFLPGVTEDCHTTSIMSELKNVEAWWPSLYGSRAIGEREGGFVGTGGGNSPHLANKEMMRVNSGTALMN